MTCTISMHNEQQNMNKKIKRLKNKSNFSEEFLTLVFLFRYYSVFLFSMNNQLRLPSKIKNSRIFDPTRSGVIYKKNLDSTRPASRLNAETSLNPKSISSAQFLFTLITILTRGGDLPGKMSRGMARSGNCESLLRKTATL